MIMDWILIGFLALIILGCAALAIGMDVMAAKDFNDVFDDEDELV
jgi:hypothetical protein